MSVGEKVVAEKLHEMGTHRSSRKVPVCLPPLPLFPQSSSGTLLRFPGHVSSVAN